jgi:hypothetical protein
MKTTQNTKIAKKTVFVFKSVKAQDDFKTDPTSVTILMTFPG